MSSLPPHLVFLALVLSALTGCASSTMDTAWPSEMHQLHEYQFDDEFTADAIIKGKVRILSPDDSQAPPSLREQQRITTLSEQYLREVTRYWIGKKQMVNFEGTISNLPVENDQMEFSSYQSTESDARYLLSWLNPEASMEYIGRSFRSSPMTGRIMLCHTFLNKVRTRLEVFDQVKQKVVWAGEVPNSQQAHDCSGTGGVSDQQNLGGAGVALLLLEGTASLERQYAQTIKSNLYALLSKLPRIDEAFAPERRRLASHERKRNTVCRTCQ